MALTLRILTLTVALLVTLLDLVSPSIASLTLTLALVMWVAVTLHATGRWNS